MSRASARFAAGLASVGQARRFVRRALMDMGAEDLEFEASQVVSELATNSVIHAGTPFEVELVYESGTLEIRVSDSSPKSPTTKSHSPHAMTGRGLRLVAALADQWGSDVRADGKTVWCSLPARPRHRGIRDDAGIDAFAAVADDVDHAATRPSPRGRMLDLSGFPVAA